MNIYPIFLNVIQGPYWSAHSKELVPWTKIDDLREDLYSFYSFSKTGSQSKQKYSQWFFENFISSMAIPKKKNKCGMLKEKEPCRLWGSDL